MIIDKNKKKTFLIAFFEIIVWLIAIKTVIASEFDIVNIIGYALGFSFGNYIGIVITEKINNKEFILLILEYNNKIVNYLNSQNIKYDELSTTLLISVNSYNYKEVINQINKIIDNPHYFLFDNKRVNI